MKTMKMYVVAAVAVLGLLLSEGGGPRAGVAAQQAPSEAGSRQVGCFRGQPLPACRSFWILEMQAQAPLVQTTRPVLYGSGQVVGLTAFDAELEWNLGHMVNVSPRFALGGVLTVGTGGAGPLSGVKVRARRWLSDDLSVEVEGGLLRSDERYPVANGATGDVRLNIRDHGSFFVRWDGVHLSSNEQPGGVYADPGGLQQALSVGAGAGSLPAVIGTGALGLGYLVLLSLFLETS